MKHIVNFIWHLKEVAKLDIVRFRIIQVHVLGSTQQRSKLNGDDGRLCTVLNFIRKVCIEQGIPW